MSVQRLGEDLELFYYWTASWAKDYLSRENVQWAALLVMLVAATIGGFFIA